ncbi:MAG: sigma-54-dependent Fis family transcriptional regulator [Mucilaginibacter polytrichastri]|nr:sigma-54-dependent Fis family transcriptional regulator [Mucilaginibacter polytrichastri]
MPQGKILLIDDEDQLRGLLTRILELEGYAIIQAKTSREGLKKIAEHDIDVVLCDVKLPDGNGVDLIPQLKKENSCCEIISLTAYGTIKDGVKAIQNGAFDYITKGDDNDKIIPLVAKALDKARLQRQVSDLQKKVTRRFGFEQILGRSPAIKQAIDLAKRVSATDTTVLLLGETGTGKEVFAQAIHYESERRTRSFVAVNCSAFSREILESELFGHKAGAFTGAVKDKKGLFEEAHLGTIFLDEIGEMNPDLQAKLLRVLETGTFIKVGDTQTTQVQVRIIAATNRDLLKEANEGHFRSDLYYRLSVFSIELPALRDRNDDIEAIAHYYLQEFSAKVNRRITGMDAAFLSGLRNHSWPGNVRELKNVMERAIILCDEDELTQSYLPMDFHKPTDQNGTPSLRLDAIEKQHILKVLSFTKGNKTEAARMLGIGLTTLYRKMDEYRLDK